MTGWKAYEDLDGPEVFDSMECYKASQPMTTTPGVGQKVLVYVFLQGYGWATVKKDQFGGYHAESEHYIFPLEWSDTKKCWCCNSTINKSCLRALDGHRHDSGE